MPNIDRRDRGYKWWSRLDERSMIAIIENGEEDGSDHEIPVKYEVCDLCGGRGKHVNPSIDSNGLTAADFDEDPDFRENYVSGMYDVPCARCDGNRVMVVIDEDRAKPEDVQWVEHWFEDDYNDRVTRYYESGGY